VNLGCYVLALFACTLLRWTYIRDNRLRDEAAAARHERKEDMLGDELGDLGDRYVLRCLTRRSNSALTSEQTSQLPLLRLMEHVSVVSSEEWQNGRNPVSAELWGACRSWLWPTRLFVRCQEPNRSRTKIIHKTETIHAYIIYCSRDYPQQSVPYYVKAILRLQILILRRRPPAPLASIFVILGQLRA